MVWYFNIDDGNARHLSIRKPGAQSIKLRSRLSMTAASGNTRTAYEHHF